MYFAVSLWALVLYDNLNFGDVTAIASVSSTRRVSLALAGCASDCSALLHLRCAFSQLMQVDNTQRLPDTPGEFLSGSW
jgi:hypothetical protein